MLLATIKETIKKYSMLNTGDRVLVAVSGGPDSVCLLSALHSLSGELGLSLHIAHLDHMFRGKQSADEALFVADLAKAFGIAAAIEKIDVPAFCRERGLSAQAGARKVRYEFLNRVAEKIDASHIATGHTADDQAETFLMRMVRGAGVSGLSAIPPVRKNLIRPLIEVTREEALEYVNTNGLKFMTDPSNTKPLYTRNRVRLELIPLLKRFNPRIIETLASEAALLRDEDEAVEAYLATIAGDIIVQKESDLFVKRDEFNTLRPAFRRRLLRKIVGLAGAESSSLSLEQINNALSFMTAAQTGRTMNLPPGLTIGREYNHFVIRVKAGVKIFSCALAVPGTSEIPELGLDIEAFLSDDQLVGPEDKNYLWQAMFDYDKIRPLLTLRNRLPGDRFCPAGLGGRSKKLQNYFVDEKVPRRKRDSVPLLCSGEDILWVVGLRTDERFLPGAGTKRVLVVTIKSLDVKGKT